MERAFRAQHEKGPEIMLSADDYRGLSALVSAAAMRTPQLAASLAEELGRAGVLPDGSLPEQIVRMNSEVEFRDDSTGRIQIMVLVYPRDADIEKGKLSVLTPVGTALIGVPAGQSITWRTPKGEMRSLTVLAVREPKS